MDCLSRIYDGRHAGDAGGLSPTDRPKSPPQGKSIFNDAK